MNQVSTTRRSGALAGGRASTTTVEPAEPDKVEVKSPRLNAIQKLATRLDVSPARLKETLMSTVFKVSMGNNQFRTPTDDEFTALVIVAAEYSLNPLLKQMYAFPKKGGGIEPMISVDGWIHIMNSHPQFDGIEFDYLEADGKLVAIEAIIHRKDRGNPIRVPEYMDECKRETDPWRKSPRRMLRHRALIQCVRVAFGVSGAKAEGDDDIDTDFMLGGDLTPSRNEPPPMRNATRIEDRRAETIVDHGETVDQASGEVLGGEPEMVPADTEFDESAKRFEEMADDLIARARKLELIADYNKLAAEVDEKTADMPDEDMVGEINKELRAAKDRLTGR